MRKQHPVGAGAKTVGVREDDQRHPLRSASRQAC
jgi:hypothetical protein